MNKGSPALWGGVVALLVLGGAFVVFGSPERPAKKGTESQNRPALSPLARESQSLLSPKLNNVYFGMKQPELQAARPRAARRTEADEPRFFMFDERLSKDERVVYGIDNKSLELTKVQIAGRLSSVEEVAPRIALMQSRYGSPKGVWDCTAAPGQLPTRRFLYQRSALGVMDSFLLIGDTIAVTLYVAPLSILKESLTIARCKPTPPEAFARFPAVPAPSP